MAKLPPASKDEALSLLLSYRRRIVPIVQEAQDLWEVWSTFNEAGNVRQVVAASAASHAAAVYEDASLKNLVMIIVRLLDSDGQDRITFGKVRLHLRSPGVQEALVDRANTSITRIFADNTSSGETSELIINKINSFNSRFDCIRKDRTHRLKSLRQYRDAYLAHELPTSFVTIRPKHESIKTMVSEIVKLTNDFQVTISGYITEEPLHFGTASKSAIALWQAVATAFT